MPSKVIPLPASMPTTRPAYADAVTEAFTFAGWARTADTGQTEIGAISPGGNGYQIWHKGGIYARMRTVAAVSSSQGVVTDFSFGLGTDGAGNLTQTLGSFTHGGTNASTASVASALIVTYTANSTFILTHPDANNLSFFLFYVEKSPQGDAVAISCGGWVRTTPSIQVISLSSRRYVEYASIANMPTIWDGALTLASSSLSANAHEAPVFPPIFAGPDSVPWVSDTLLASAPADQGMAVVVNGVTYRNISSQVTASSSYRSNYLVSSLSTTNTTYSWHPMIRWEA